MLSTRTVGRRCRVLIAMLGVVVLGANIACKGGDGARTSTPNVIIISADTLRWDHVGANGYARDTTPNIDQLAVEGVNFRQAYAQAPFTAPSHTSILSSMYPSVHGVFNHGQTLDESVVTLPEAFQQAGYATAAFTQLNGRTYRQGFDTYAFLESPYENGGKGLGDLTPATDWIERHSERPFFLFLHSYDVHLPYKPPPEYIERWAADYEGPLPKLIRRRHIDAINAGETVMTPRDYQYLIDMYDAELSRADEIYGRFFETLRRLEVYDNTVIAFFSDHGEEMGEHGQWGRHSYSLYNELLRTPLIIRGPGIPSGAQIDAPVGLVDMAPTLLQLAGIELPETFMGQDLEPLWSGRERQPRDVIAEKLESRVLIAAGYKLFSDGRLFDLEADPNEHTDVAETEPEVRELMQEKLDRWAEILARAGEGIESAGPVTLTKEDKRRLRDLGYLQ